MANVQQPTRQTRHMDIKTFALQDWIEKYLILMKRINTADNCADALTKTMGRQLHYRHNDYIGKNHTTICCRLFHTTPYRSIIKSIIIFVLCSIEHAGVCVIRTYTGLCTTST